MGSSLVITTGGGTDTSEGNPNVVEKVVLTGYTIYNFEGEKLTGSMPTQSTSASNLNPGNEITIPLGFHDGNHTVGAAALSSKTGASAEASHVLNSYTGWKNGSLVTGSMTNRGKTNGTLSANGTYTIPGGWHNGEGKVTQSLSTQEATSITPSTSQKTVIASSKWSTGNQVVVGSGNLSSGNIKKGVSIFGVTGTFTQASVSGLYHNGTFYNGAYLGYVGMDPTVPSNAINSGGKLIPDPNVLNPDTWKYVRITVRFADIEQVLRNYSKIRVVGYYNRPADLSFGYFGIGALAYIWTDWLTGTYHWCIVPYKRNSADTINNFFFVNATTNPKTGSFDYTVDLPEDRIEQCDRLQGWKNSGVTLQFVASWWEYSNTYIYATGVIHPGSWISTYGFIN